MTTLADLTTAVPAAIVTVAIVTVAGWPVDRRVKEADAYADTIACGAGILTADPWTGGAA